MRYRALIFDLFGTVVLFKPHVPSAPTAGRTWRWGLPWLRAGVAQELPHVPFDEFAGALLAVTEEIVRARPPEFREVSCGERFRRALERLGVVGEDTVAKAERLSLMHMAHVAAQTETPLAHDPLLRSLAGSYRLGLVSNFDHGPTAHAILARDGLADVFGVTLISDDFGRRKPHPAIFREALHRLDVRPGEALYIGDSATDDVCGASSAGMDVAWINARNADVPVPAPKYIICELAELPAVLT